jgi:hypothetical protein
MLRIFKSLLLIVLTLSCDELLARGSSDTHRACSSGAKSSHETIKKNYLDLAIVIDESLKPLYNKKYRIQEFLTEAVVKAPQNQKDIEESLNRNLKNLLEDKTNEDSETDIIYAISQVFTKVGEDIPAVKEIADNYSLKLRLNANADPKVSLNENKDSGGPGRLEMKVGDNLSVGADGGVSPEGRGTPSKPEGYVYFHLKY